MNVIAIIIGRGGSTRIPRKNVREFGDKPMIAWPVGMAFQSGLFSRIVVSTDDPEIADAARDAGADFPILRPAELSDDRCGTLEVMGHAVRVGMDRDWVFDAACCIYATAAFTSSDDLRAAEELHAQGWDYVFAAGRFQRAPQRAFVRKPGGEAAMLLPHHASTRSQDLEPSFFDAGQFYWGSAAAWREQRPIFGNRTTFVELPPERAIDIDTPDDWAIALKQFEQWKRRDG